jgi:hypothetical protein
MPLQILPFKVRIIRRKYNKETLEGTYKKFGYRNMFVYSEEICIEVIGILKGPAKSVRKLRSSHKASSEIPKLTVLVSIRTDHPLTNNNTVSRSLNTGI